MVVYLTILELPSHLLAHYQTGLFDQELHFIKNNKIREEVGAILYVLLVSESVAQHLYLEEWFISTRQLAKMMDTMGFEGYEDVQEAGRRKAGRRLSWVVDGLGKNSFPCFHIAREHDAYSARRLSINQDYGWMLDDLPDALKQLILAIPRYGREVASFNNKSVGTHGASVGEPGDIMVGVDPIDNLELLDILDEEEDGQDAFAEADQILREAGWLK